ncbi:MAG: hypothetical protein U1F36_01715 [Planctomycetota bacterium]
MNTLSDESLRASIRVGARLVLAITALTYAALHAQEQPKADPHCTLRGLLGAPVRLAAEAEGPPDTVKDATAPQKTARASIARIAIDVGSGTLSHFVIDVAALDGGPEKQVAIPASAMRRDASAVPRVAFLLDTTREKLATLPAFLAKDLDKQGLDTLLDRADAAWSGGTAQATEAVAKKAEGESAKGEDRKPGTDAPPAAIARHLLAGSLLGAVVLARKDVFGRVGEVFTDAAARRAEFATVLAGDEVLLMPFPALEPMAGERVSTLCVDCSAEMLRKDGVRYQKPVDALLDPKSCEAARRAFGRTSR